MHMCRSSHCWAKDTPLQLASADTKRHTVCGYVGAHLAHLGFNGLGGEVATTPDALEWDLAGQAARGIAVV